MPNYTPNFEILGAYARAFKQFHNLAGRDLEITDSGETFRSLDRLRAQFIAVLNDEPAERDRLDAVALLTDAARTVGGWSAQLQQSLDAWVRDGLSAAVSLRGAANPDILRALARAMHADAESVQQNVVSADAPVPGANNAGNAACCAGVDTVDHAEDAIPDQRARTQSIALECVRDAVHHRLPLGQEEFRVTPEFGPAVATRVIPVTCGDVPDARNAVLDGAFVADDLAHWEDDSSGLFSRDTAQALFGAASLKVDGTGAGELAQDFAARDPVLPAGRFFALGAWARVAAIADGSLSVELLIDGTPATPALVFDDATLTGAWLHRAALVYVPRASFPNKLAIRVRASADFDGELNLDGVSFAPAVEVPHAGLRLAVFQGPVATHAGDRFEIATDSDDAGAFQTFARDRLGLALPASATPTIDDSLAE